MPIKESWNFHLKNVIFELKSKIDLLRELFELTKIYLILLIVFMIFLPVLFSYLRIPPHTDLENTRNMLSVLVQSEVAVFAIVISVSLVAVEIAASKYSFRVIDVFKNTPSLWFVVETYLIAIVFGLGLLNLINNNNLSEFDAHIWSAYFLGIFSFVALVPYILNIIELLKPSTLIEKLAKRITVENILSAFKDVKNFKERQYYPVVDMEKDSIQPIIDIVRSSMISYDYETVRYGLKTIGNSTKCMLNDEFLDEKSESEISKHIFHNFTTIGKIAADKNDESFTIEILNNLYMIGEVAVNNKLKNSTMLVITSLGDVGKVCAEKEFEITNLFISALWWIGRGAADNKLEDASYITAMKLNGIGKVEAKHNLENLKTAAFYLRACLNIQSLFRNLNL